MKIVARNISKIFNDKVAVNKVDFVLKEGIIGLIGANGAGKTTLMKMLCTLLKPTSGEFSCNGIAILKLGDKYRDIIGYLPQDFGYYPDYTAYDFLMYIAALKGIDKKQGKQKIDEILSLVGLIEVKKKKIKTFSGGMIRRLGIAQAIINDPLLLVLDEPTAGLDIKERVRFRNIISSLGKDRIVLLSTHIVSDVAYIANEVMLLKKGEIIANGSVQEITSRVKDFVWELTIQNNEVEYYNQKYCIGNMRNENNTVVVRIVSEEKPHENAISKEPTLEDVYLFEFREEMVNE